MAAKVTPPGQNGCYLRSNYRQAANLPPMNRQNGYSIGKMMLNT